MNDALAVMVWFGVPCVLWFGWWLGTGHQPRKDPRLHDRPGVPPKPRAPREPLHTEGPYR